MSTGTQVAVITATVILVMASIVSLLVLAITAQTRRRRIAAAVGLVLLFVLSMVAIARSVDAGCRNPNDRPCVGVSKDPQRS